MDDQRFTEVKTIVCETLELDPAEVTATSLFTDDHGADSMNVVEIVAALERSFDVVIDQADIERMVNLRGVCDVLAETARAA